MVKSMCLISLALLFGSCNIFKNSSSEQGITMGSIESYSTLNSVGIEWAIRGDDNHYARCSVRYRSQGGTWHNGMDLYRVDFQGWYGSDSADRHYNMLAGSIFFLEENTLYEVELTVEDPHGFTQSRTLSIATKDRPLFPQGGNDIFCQAGGPGTGDGSRENPYREFWRALADAQPGDTIRLTNVAGDFTERLTMNDISGEQGNYIGLMPAEGEQVTLQQLVIMGSYLWIEGFYFDNMDGTSNDGLRTDSSGAWRNVVVLKNQFRGYNNSIHLNPHSHGWYIGLNDMVGLNDPDISNIVGEGIELAHSSDHVVAYNRITRSADGISYPHRNCDIYGNYIYQVSDDGIETDYGYANIRVWGNYVYNSHNSAISFQPQFSGPWYFIRNVLVNGGSQMAKVNVTDRFLMANNTLIGWTGMQLHAEKLLTGRSRNNLWVNLNSGDEYFWWAYTYDENHPESLYSRGYFMADWRTDMDYDAFLLGGSSSLRWNEMNISSMEDLFNTAEIEENGLWLDQGAEQVFQNPGNLQLGSERNSKADEYTNLRLQSGSVVVDSGEVQSNLDRTASGSHYYGSSVDLGAFESGRSYTSSPTFGPRGEGIPYSYDINDYWNLILWPND